MLEQLVKGGQTVGSDLKGGGVLQAPLLAKGAPPPFMQTQ